MLKNKKQTTIFGILCKSVDYAPYVHIDEVNNVTSDCSSNERMNIVTCLDEDIEDDIADVGGLDMVSVILQNPYQGEIPRFIPVIPKDLFKKNPEEIPYEVVGVGLEDIFTKRIYEYKGEYRLPSILKVNTELLNLPVFQGKKVVLFCSGRDLLIETLWAKRRDNDFFDEVASMNFMAITGMNFSLFCGECALGHVINIQKSLRHCEHLDFLSVSTIPHVYAVSDHQRKRWMEWLKANSNVQWVTMNLQLQKSQPDRLEYDFGTILYLLQNTEVKIILHGARIPKELKEYEKRLSVAASYPLMKYVIVDRSQTIAEHIETYIASFITTPSQK